MKLTIDRETFAATWLQEVTDGDPSTTELGRRFAFKIITQWLDEAELGSDLVYCDGSGDGGIDIAYLSRGESEDATDSSSVGDTWYLVQSKHGSAFRGVNTLLEEGQKVIDTLDGVRSNLSSLASGLLDRLRQFRKSASERDKIVLVFATQSPLTDTQTRTLADLRAMGRSRLGANFDVEAISIETIFERIVAQTEVYEPKVRVNLSGKLVSSGDDLLVGSVGIVDLYEFLKAYRSATNDLDQLYEKNVRKFLGLKGRINKAIVSTLNETPERFGLFNNGITIVANDYENGHDFVSLCDPYIVNGCQTTRSIWEVCQRKLDAGGTGVDDDLEAWRKRAEDGVVVVKVAKVGGAGEALSQTITRFTNSQNAVRERDFLTLTGDFRQWQSSLADERDLYLEIQRGGWDSQRALQKQNPTLRQFSEMANAADLLKVYGAGWLGEPGLAFGKNPPFLPGGSIFKRIVENTSDGGLAVFGADDLYAAYLLQKAADEFKFGRGSNQVSRRQTRFLFYMIAIDLIKEVIIRSGRPAEPAAITETAIKILGSAEPERADFLALAIDAIDSYMTRDTDNSVFNEPAFTNTFNNDMNGFLKWEQLGKREDSSPMLRQLISLQKMVMGSKAGGQASLRDRLINL